MDKNYPHSQIVSQVISDITSQMDINNYDMGENIYLGNLFQKINSVNGVLNVIEIRVYNNVGGIYSVNEITQPYLDKATRQVDLSGDYTLFGEPMTMFEILKPESDIIVRVK